MGACVFVLRHWDILRLEIYRTHLLLNTNAETAHYIQDALVAKVYTSAKAVLALASACQVSAHTSAWVTQVYVYAWAKACPCNP